MSETVTSFPNMLQPTAALKTYAPVSVKFWEAEENVLGGMKEYADGWFTRRRIGTQAALDTAKRLGEAATPLDALREYQDWANGAFARLMEDGLAFQQQMMRVSNEIGAKMPTAESDLIGERPKSEERRSA
ncbi:MULTISPECIES: hypothetical protein [Rhodopseudomonas]|uniref:Phasin domain-containing protein n=1 Tax=Rhodopseudomonas palustris TaxID=1076 RepID=A0A0D7EUP3_RHOPL|nr:MULTISPECIES: hypothetical protein [Rhodopseudomonas]KIZ44265.1 hypothetical protein OO17_10080 [Rhodopseudomonas palustris]MDF3812194.1 hypothetical protein [Rhodopseudomonas sp. BAL398]WOK18099.1 hypothetical protein RBJ75_00810 [Rhodopseudomonas sp. BAL398]